MDVFNAIIEAFGSQKGDANYNPDVDFDGNGLINSIDWSIARQKYSSPADYAGAANAAGGVPVADKDDVFGFNYGLVNLVLDAFGSQKGDANYNAAADLNSDGLVNIVDFNLAKAQGNPAATDTR
jgi:hypothetical protein